MGRNRVCAGTRRLRRGGDGDGSDSGRDAQRTAAEMGSFRHFPSSVARSAAEPPRCSSDGRSTERRAFKPGTGEMAQRETERVGSVGGLRRLRKIEQSCYHRLHLVLLSRPVPGHSVLHLVGGVLVHLATPTCGKRKRQPAGLPDTHCGSGGGREEHALDDDCVGGQSLEQRVELFHHAGQPEVDRIGVRSLQHTVFDGLVAIARPGLDQAEPAARQTGVDSEHEHTFEL